MTELIVSIYYFASAGSFYTNSLSKDNLKWKETLKGERFQKNFNFSPLANANISGGGWSPILKKKKKNHSHRDYLLFSPLFFLFKNCMHNEVLGFAEI